MTFTMTQFFFILAGSFLLGMIADAALRFRVTFTDRVKAINKLLQALESLHLVVERDAIKKKLLDTINKL